MGEQLPRPATEEEPITLDIGENIQLGYNSIADSFEKTVHYRVSAEPLEQKAVAREEVTWLKARGSDMINIISTAPNQELVEEHVVGFMKHEAKAFAHTKTGEIVLPTRGGLSEIEEEVVMARALIESVRESERVGEEATIANLREELTLAQNWAMELETAKDDLAIAQGRIDALEALVTPDVLTQAQVIRDRDEQIKALLVQNEVLRSRANRPSRALRINAGFMKVANLGLRGHA